MAIFTIAGLRYYCGDHATKEQRDAAAESYLASVPAGATFWLKAEPSNKYDPLAVAVYDEDMCRRGHVSGADAAECHRYLSRGIAEASFVDHDGHVTYRLAVEGEPEGEAPQAAEWVPSPLRGKAWLQVRDEEERRTMLLGILYRTPVDPATAAKLLGWVERCVELTNETLCGTDIRGNIALMSRLVMLEDEAEALGLGAEHIARIKRSRALLADRLGDLTAEGGFSHIMRRQLAALRLTARQPGGLFAQYDALPPADDISIDSLRRWLAEVVLTEAFDDADTLARTIRYARLEVDQLYEVYAAMLLIERAANKECERLAQWPGLAETLAYVAPVRQYASAAWAPRWDELWTDLLTDAVVARWLLKKHNGQGSAPVNTLWVCNIICQLKKLDVVRNDVKNKDLLHALGHDAEGAMRNPIGKVPANEDVVREVAQRVELMRRIL